LEKKSFKSTREINKINLALSATSYLNDGWQETICPANGGRLYSIPPEI